MFSSQVPHLKARSIQPSLGSLSPRSRGRIFCSSHFLFILLSLCWSRRECGCGLGMIDMDDTRILYLLYGEQRRARVLKVEVRHILLRGNLFLLLRLGWLRVCQSAGAKPLFQISDCYFGTELEVTLCRRSMAVCGRMIWCYPLVQCPRFLLDR